MLGKFFVGRNIAARFVFIAAIAGSMPLSGCGDSGPTNSDIKNAFIKQIDEATKAAGNDRMSLAILKMTLPDMSKYEIKESKCSNAGKDIYDCVVIASYQGSNETKQMKFVKLKAGWAIVQ